MMGALTLLGSLLAATRASPVLSNPNLTFVDFTTKHGCVCSPHTGLCRCFVHLVYAVTPEHITNSLIGGGTYTIKDTRTQSIQIGGDMQSERHIISGVCNCNATYCDYDKCNNSTGTAQMWNWGFENVHPISDLANLPKQICPQVWIRDLTTGGQSSHTVGCLEMSITQVQPSSLALPMVTAVNAFSSAASVVVDSLSSSMMRSNIHIVFTVAPKDPTHLLIGGAVYSFDHGQTWASTGSSTYYEQHIDFAGGRWNQAWQFDYDRVHHDDGSAPSEACFKVWLTDTVTSETVWLNATDDSWMHCMPVCDTIVQFHWPDGYCAGQPGMRSLPVPTPRAIPALLV
jgi:hypothetical protein